MGGQNSKASIQQVDANFGKKDVEPKQLASLEEIEVVFVDCDDTLYQNEYRTEAKLREKIGRYCEERFNVTKEVAFELYREHGTTLRGMIALGIVQEDIVDEYLRDVHLVDLSDIRPDPMLRRILASMKKRLWIFTASSAEHAKRCVEILGLQGIFEGIIDCRTVDLFSKHDESSFKKAMQVAGVRDPRKCMLLDDSLQNIETAAQLGWRHGLVGLLDRNNNPKQPKNPDIVMNSLHDLPEKCPEFFEAEFLQHWPEIVELDHDDLSAQEVFSDDEADAGFQIENIGLDKPKRVVFVLGGPGSGKGTQCGLLSEKFEFEHLSVGALLRKASNDPKNPFCEEIKRHLIKGTLVPSELIVDLLLETLESSDFENFLVDGFPRSMDNFNAWYGSERASQKAFVAGVFVLECPEETLVQRLKARGRSDDHDEAIKSRVHIFNTVTLEVIEHFEKKGDALVWRIDADRDRQTVFKEMQAVLAIHIPESIYGISRER